MSKRCLVNPLLPPGGLSLPHGIRIEGFHDHSPVPRHTPPCEIHREESNQRAQALCERKPPRPDHTERWQIGELAFGSR